MLSMLHRRKLIQNEERFFAEVRRAVSDRKEGRRSKPAAGTCFQSFGALIRAIACKLGLR